MSLGLGDLWHEWSSSKVLDMSRHPYGLFMENKPLGSVCFWFQLSWNTWHLCPCVRSLANDSIYWLLWNLAPCSITKYQPIFQSQLQPMQCSWTWRSVAHVVPRSLFTSPYYLYGGHEKAITDLIMSLLRFIPNRLPLLSMSLDSGDSLVNTRFWKRSRHCTMRF